MSDLVPTGFESIDGPGTEPASALPVQDRPASLFRNTTHLVEIIIPRRSIDKGFRLSQ